MTESTTAPAPAWRAIFSAGLWRDNIAAVQLLGLCPMIAVSADFGAAVVLGLATAAVMAVCGAVVALCRPVLPAAVRLPIFLLVVAAAVGAVDLALAAWAFEWHRKLGIFVALILTNCAVLARLEVFASKQGALAAFCDGLAMGGGMLLALAALALARQALGPAAAAPFGGFVLFAFLVAAWQLARDRNADRNAKSDLHLSGK